MKAGEAAMFAFKMTTDYGLVPHLPELDALSEFQWHRVRNIGR